MSFENPDPPQRLAPPWLPPLLIIGLSLYLLGCTSTPTPPMSSQSSQSPPSQSPPTPNPQAGQQLPLSATAQIGETSIQLEVARSLSEQAMGLMFRPALPDDRGMLFPMSPPRQVQFWMRNVPVALDMVFLYEGTVKAIATAPPCPEDQPRCPTYGPMTLVDQVIELRAGRAAELKVKVGDRILVQNIDR